MKSFDDLVAALDDTDQKRQDTALNRLRKQWAPELRPRLIAAAARSYPNDSKRVESLGAQLLRACWNIPHVEYIPAIVAHYTALSTHREKQWHALRILTELQTPQSLQAFVELLARPESSSTALGIALVPLMGSEWGDKQPPPVVTAMFPRWFDLVEQLADVHHAYSFILRCHAAGLLSFEAYPQFVCDCVTRARRDLEIVSETSASGFTVTTPDSGKAQVELEWLLDLFSYMEHADIPQLLVDSLERAPDGITLFAIPAMLGRGLPVSDERLTALAQRPWQRHRLWRLLERSENLARFPSQYRTIPMLAEANLVQWLEFPTELGRAPEEIEPLTVVHSCDKQGQPVESHFFKFRHPEFRKGKWFVGFAGTYASNSAPTLFGAGTFSRFQELDSKPLAEHVADYLK